MKYALIGFLIAAAILWGMGLLLTGNKVVEEGRVPFGDGLELPYRITSEGGALGHTRYEVFAERDGARIKIFEGIGGAGFHVDKAGPGLIRIRFCNGQIDHISAVAATETRARVIVQPDLDCSK